MANNNQTVPGFSNDQQTRRSLQLLDAFAQSTNRGAIPLLIGAQQRRDQAPPPFVGDQPTNPQSEGSIGLPQPGDIAGELARKGDLEAQIEFIRRRSAIPTSVGLGALPGAQSFAPGGPQLNFGGGSPFPVDPRPAIVQNGLLLATRILNALKKDPQSGDGQGQGSPAAPQAAVPAPAPPIFAPPTPVPPQLPRKT